ALPALTPAVKGVVMTALPLGLAVVTVLALQLPRGGGSVWGWLAVVLGPLPIPLFVVWAGGLAGQQTGWVAAGVLAWLAHLPLAMGLARRFPGLKAAAWGLLPVYLLASILIWVATVFPG
ncbi:MAG: hypothetical protein OEW12_09360, partial [Deltaproteobacteria bacterium]|nr:hypothetical protein [Deltaproteobacteria bacterium]